VAPAAAQVARPMHHVGYVANVISPDEIPGSPCGKGFSEVLRGRGWTDDNLKIHWRSAEQQFDRRPAIIAELLRVPVDVLVVAGNPAVDEALERTRTVPVVATYLFRPWEYAPDVAHPGGNLTGVSTEAGRGIEGKRLALLKEVAPATTRVAVLNHGDLEPLRSETLAAAQSLGISLFHQKFELGRAEEAIDEAVRQGADAIYVAESQVFSRRDNLAGVRRAIERHRLPAMYFQQFASDDGGLVTYSEDFTAGCRFAADYVDKILRGTKPGDLPIVRPAKHELVINLKAARSIGLVIPTPLLLQADRVIR
jgi:putative ABC transport system substrate-binding protein